MSFSAEEYDALMETCLKCENLGDVGIWGIFADFLDENDDTEEGLRLAFRERSEFIRYVIFGKFGEVLGLREHLREKRTKFSPVSVYRYFKNDGGTVSFYSIDFIIMGTTISFNCKKEEYEGFRKVFDNQYKFILRK